MHKKSIFHDPSGRRRFAVNVIGVGLILGAFVIGVLGYLGIIYGPALQHDARSHDRSEVSIAAARPVSISSPDEKLSGLNTRALPDTAHNAMRFAYFDIGDVASHESLHRNATKLDAVLPNFLALDAKTKELKQVGEAIERRVRDQLTSEAPGLKVYPVLSSQLSPKETMAQFSSYAIRSEYIRVIGAYLEDANDAGIVVDLGDIPPSAFGYFLEFVYELADSIRPTGRKVIVADSLNLSKPQVQKLASIVDYIIADTAGLFDGTAKGGAPAAQAKFEAAVQTFSESVAAEKLIFAVGSYACDGTSGGSCVPISVPNAWTLIGRSSATLVVNLPTLNGHFSYADGLGRVHDVWLLDATSAFNQARVALGVHPAGLAMWRLGYEDPAVWSIFAKGRLPETAALADLERLPAIPIFDDSVVNSEMITDKLSGSEGARVLTYDEGSGLIVGQTITKLPTADTFGSWKAKDKNVLAITFDDGPDDRNTNKILDVLAEKGVPATFFVLGRNALRHPEILKRIYREGHDIGNHTFSHPRLSEVPSWQMRYELNATQRVLEFLLGVHTRLFRPPYGGAPIIGQPDNSAVIQQALQMGYTTVLSGVDAGDWLNPSANVIHDRIVARVLKGEGQIILLHDWGRRKATVGALPRIIDTLHAKGFRFATVHELLGEKRSDVMQSSEGVDAVSSAKIEGGYVGIIAYQMIETFIATIAILVITFNLARLLFSVVGTIRHKAIERQRSGHKYWPSSVAVIVPAHNEATVICKTIASILSSTRTDFDIIVVDDGSTDGTAAVVEQAYGHDARIKVFKKPNGGKAEAANYALKHTQAEVVIALDADGVLDRQAIELMVRHFEDPQVGAVAGTAIVGNKVNLLTRFQALEYMVGQYLDRRALSLFNAISVVPGAIGAWRRETLLGAGGYATDTVAEDCDATFSVIRTGWKVVYEPAAEARTEAPETLRGFLKQRRRWMFGMLQVVGKHISAVRGRPRGLGWLTIPHVLIFGFVVSIATPILAGTFLYQVIAKVLSWSATTDPRATQDLSLYVKWWFVLSVADLVIITVVLRLAGIASIAKQIPLIVLQRIIFLPIIYWVAYETILAALKGKIVGWNKLKRTGTVSLEQKKSISETP